MFDLPPLYLDPPTIVEPMEVKKRKSRDSRHRARNRWGVYVWIGMVLLLDDGTECVVSYIDQFGTPWCNGFPVEVRQ